VESRANITAAPALRVQEVLASPMESGHRVRYENDNGSSETIAGGISFSTPPDAAPSRSPCCNRSAAAAERPPSGIDLGYATCIFAIPDDAPTDWKGVMTFGQAPQNSRVACCCLRGQPWMATIGGATVTCRPAIGRAS